MSQRDLWCILFFFQLGILAFCSLRLIQARHEAQRLRNELAATVEECGEAWLAQPLTDIQRALTGR